MGWYGSYCGESLREIKDCIESELVQNKILDDGDQFRQNVLYHSFKYGESYIALEQVRTQKDGLSRTRRVFALVTLWKYSKKDGQVMTKTMDESCGPYYFKAPLKLIKLLTEPLNDNAHNWRVAVCKNYKRGVPKEYTEYREREYDVS